MLNGKKQLTGWLAGLALCPVVGWGQEELRFIRHPEDVMVCPDEVAEFSVIATGGHLTWGINGIGILSYPEFNDFITRDQPVKGGVLSTFSIPRLAEQITGFNNSLIYAQTVRYPFWILSNNATLVYKTNQQFQVTGLNITVTNTTAQFNWDGQGNHTHYIFGVYDDNNHQITNQTINITHASFDIPDNACRLEFRVTGVNVQYPECPDIEQTRYSAYLYTKLDISPVTTEFNDNNQTVLVSWTPDGNGTVWVSVTDLDRGDAVQVKDDNSPFTYTLAVCGQFNLNVSVSPSECLDEPAFTYSGTIHFTIPCPTTTTEATETETSGEHSGILALAPSSLPVIAAAATLIRYFLPR